MISDDSEDEVAYHLDGRATIHFTDHGLHHFNASERVELEKLHLQRAEKFDEICLHLSNEYGYGSDLKALPKERLNGIIEEAEVLTEAFSS